MHESDLSFLEKLGAERLSSNYWQLTDCDEASYEFHYQEAVKDSHVAVWTIDLESNHNTAFARELCHDGQLRASFDNLKRIALFMASIPNLPII